jgi:hypothetical protein
MWALRNVVSSFALGVSWLPTYSLQVTFWQSGGIDFQWTFPTANATATAAGAAVLEFPMSLEVDGVTTDIDVCGGGTCLGNIEQNYAFHLGAPAAALATATPVTGSLLAPGSCITMRRATAE